MELLLQSLSSSILSSKILYLYSLDDHWILLNSIRVISLFKKETFERFILSKIKNLGSLKLTKWKSVWSKNCDDLKIALLNRAFLKDDLLNFVSMK